MDSRPGEQRDSDFCCGAHCGLRHGRQLLVGVYLVDMADFTAVNKVGTVPMLCAVAAPRRETCRPLVAVRRWLTTGRAVAGRSTPSFCRCAARQHGCASACPFQASSHAVWARSPGYASESSKMRTSHAPRVAVVADMMFPMCVCVSFC